ncbi:reverse transcriptase domain-containing protein [Tanacetum coccineum]
MFLGYKVNTKGIKVCSDKVDVVLSLPSLKCLKDVQKLNGKLASLNRFLAKSAEKSLAFFKTMKKCTKKSNFHWIEEAESAFKQMMQLIAELPTLTAPEEKEELIVYLAAAKEAQILSRPEVAGRLQKWSIELGEYAIHYRPRVSIMGQILADFIVERPEGDSLDTPMEVEEERPKPWILFTDGSSCANGSGAGVILTNPEGAKFTYALRIMNSGRNGCKKPPVPRSENKKADALSKIASTSFAHLSKQVLVKELKEKSVNEVEVLAVVEEEGNTWMTPIYEYLTKGTLPAKANKEKAVQRNMHAGTRFVVAKALRTGYCWPTMHKDARALIRACQDCQVHRPIPRNLQKKLTLIMSPCLFYKWGIDIVGPFSEGPGNQVKKKLWDNIVYRFGLPGEIISDNGKQFRDNPFKDWCKKLCIRQHFASVKHLQANGLVERANRSLGEGIKERLDASSKN